MPPLPSNDRVSYLFKYYWNCGVKSTFRFLVDLPTHATDAAVKSYNYINSALDSFESSPPSLDSKNTNQETK